MLFDDLFTTYRRAISGTKRVYSGSATITNGYGLLTQLDGAMKATLGIEYSVRAYLLQTEETNIQIDDKVVISSASYYVKEVEIVEVHSIELTRAMLYKK